MSLSQWILMLLTFAGSLCMNLGGAWKRWGVLLGILNGPLWLMAELRAGNQGGMFLASLLIWLTYFVGLWKIRDELRGWFMAMLGRDAVLFMDAGHAHWDDEQEVFVNCPAGLRCPFI